METKHIDEAISKNGALSKHYAEKMTQNVLERFRDYELANQNLKNDIEKSLNLAMGKKEYDAYIDYLMSDQFEHKEKELTDKVEQLILDKIPKPNNSHPYLYMVIAALFIFQIGLFITK